MASVFADYKPADGMSRYGVAAAGVAAGVGLDQAAMAVKQARTRGSWALGIGVGLAALAAVASSGLGADVQTAASLAQEAQGITFTTGAGVTGEQVSELRAVTIKLANLAAQIAYDANYFSFTPPTQFSAPSQIASVSTGTTTVTTVANSSAVILALVVLGVLAIALWG